MNTYELSLEYSFWIFVLLSIAAITFSIYTYRNTIPQISRRKKSLLITIRSLALVLLLFLIFKPGLKKSSGISQEPKVLALVDNSISMGLEDNSINRLKSTQNLYNTLEGNENVDILNFDYNLNNGDSLTFQGEATNIYNALDQIRNKFDKENYTHVLLISDGVVNSGNSPIYLSEKIGKPIYTIVIGDTIAPLDLSVENILSNEMSYINTPTPIITKIKNDGFGGDSLKVKFLEEGKIFEEITIFLDETQKFYELQVNYESKTPGTKKISVVIENKENEVSYKNNTTSTFIEIRDNKKKIVLLSGRPSYDLSFITKEIKTLENYELISYIQKDKKDISADINLKDLSESELLILVGFPNQYISDKLVQMVLKELKRGKPLLFLASSDLDYNKLMQLKSYLPFDIQSFSNNFMEVEVAVNPEEKGNLLLKTETNEEKGSWGDLPPVYRSESLIKPKTGARSLLSLKLNNNIINEPILLSYNVGEDKSVFILAYGLYRWKLGHYAKNKAAGYEVVDYYSSIIQNSLLWLTTDKDFKNFFVKTDKKRYTINEEIVFYGTLKDDAMQQLNNAEIEVNYKSENTENSIILMEVGNGQYMRNVKILQPGDYTFKAIAKDSDGKIIGTHNGRFSIGDVNLEYSSYTSNKKLMQQISELTGGKSYYNPKELKSIIKEMQGDVFFKARYLSTISNINLWNLPLLLILSLLLFSTEWVIRKISGMI